MAWLRSHTLVVPLETIRAADAQLTTRVWFVGRQIVHGRNVDEFDFDDGVRRSNSASTGGIAVDGVGTHAAVLRHAIPA